MKSCNSNQNESVFQLLGINGSSEQMFFGRFFNHLFKVFQEIYSLLFLGGCLFLIKGV